MPQFRTKTGRLSAYSFACGYIEEKTTNSEAFRERDLYTQLYQDGCFHVQQFDRRNGPIYNGPVMWECFDTLQEARKCFDCQPGKIVKKG